MANLVQSKVIGFHASPEVMITFRETDGKIEATVPLETDPVSVTLPDLRLPDTSTDFTIAHKVKRLLQNCHLQPTYFAPKGQTKGRVSFIPVDPENKTWEKQDELSFPEAHTPYFFRAEGTLCYAFVNTVTTWDWKNSSFTTTTFRTTSITALAELPDGRFIIGDEKGNLFLQGNPQSYPCGIQEKIEKIVFITSTCYFISSKNKTVIFSLESATVLSELASCIDFFILKNGMFCLLDTYKLFLMKINEENKILVIKHDFEDIAIVHVQVASENTLLLAPQVEKSIIVWNYEKQTHIEYKDEKTQTLRRKMSDDNLVLINEETFAYPKRQSPQVCFYRAKDKESIETQPAGERSVAHFIPLSDGSIMYATESGSGIHVVTREGTLAFTSKNLTNARPVQSIRELGDGSVAIEFYKHMMIICPKKNPRESTAYKIDKLLLDLKHNPAQFDLYDELANLYGKDNEKRYQTYLAGSEAAIKGNNLYQARRYYEKAKKLKIKSDQPSDIFNSYLKGSAYKKQQTQVALDLYYLQSESNSSTPPPSKADRKCKERLFIGEGDFSFTAAFIEKHQQSHPKLASAITATELDKPTKEETLKRITQLQDKRVKFLFGIDGQLLDQIFKGKRFRRIHWNCPYVDFTTSNREAFKDVIPKFFLSCSQLQLTQDRVHITLMQEKDGYWRKRQEENPIVKGATLAGYRLIRKRLFGAERYPGYEHVKTDKKSHGKNEEMREFVFEKTEITHLSKEATDLPKMAHELKNPDEKKYQVKTSEANPKDTDYYFECSTDEDSSDYYESDPDNVTP
ncbi:MAG: DUF2431 domain-containing protein [Verrucomicrobia bacterium]|nr:DUF2431 domain-containing protein [Verrucomicrobiota bacterium]